MSRMSAPCFLSALPCIALSLSGLAVPCQADIVTHTQLCWAAPPTASATPLLAQAGYDDCQGVTEATAVTSNSLTVVTPGSNGNQTFTASGFAFASPTEWEVSTDLTLSNYLREMYQWSQTSNGLEAPTTDDGSTYLSDTITVTAGGGPGVFSLSYIFSLDGTLTSSDPSLFSAQFCTSIDLPQGVGTVTSFCLQPGQTVPSTFTLTYADLPFNAPITPTLTIGAYGFVTPILPGQVATLGGSIINGGLDVDFGATVNLLSLLVTNSSGDPIPDVTISSLSGYNYPLSPLNQATPEPASLALLLTVLIGLVAARWKEFGRWGRRVKLLR
jgi:hypothetical protein